MKPRRGIRFGSKGDDEVSSFPKDQLMYLYSVRANSTDLRLDTTVEGYRLGAIGPRVTTSVYGIRCLELQVPW